eukprot:c1978_g1_i1.p1 GENE.c1978_g1_i1~~c1978_g1_i1.p1  ORF type:complete len:173 (+),score=31.43 c1978_g1_i1:73-519(+)
MEKGPLMTAVCCGQCQREFLFPDLTSIALCPFCGTANQLPPSVQAIPYNPPAQQRSVVVIVTSSNSEFLPSSSFNNLIPHSMSCKCSICFKYRDIPVDVIERSIRDAEPKVEPKIGPYVVNEYKSIYDNSTNTETDGYKISEYKSDYE